VRALAFAPGLALITAEVPGSRRATAMSLFMASGFGANLVLSVVAPLLVDALGWRGLIALFGIASLAPVTFYWIVSRHGAADPRPLAAGAGGSAGSILRQPIVWLSAVVQFTRLGVMSSIRFWLPTYLVVDKGFDLATAAVVVAVASALSIVTTLVGAQVSDRRQQPVPVILISLGALAVGLVLLTQVHEFLLILLVTGGLYVFVQAYSGSLFEVPLLVLGTGSAGTLNGFGNAWANVGGLVMTFALGVSKDATASFDSGWVGLALLCLVAIVATLFMVRLLRSHAQRVDVTPSTAAPGGYDA
jgi:nitrate/nitrite transporter NarK